WSGAYGVRSGLAPVGLWAQGALFVFGALIVGVVEELIFRGGIFGMARRGCGVVGGALVTGVLFAGVHFADPEPPDGVVYGHWYAGLRMIPYMFTPHDFIAHNGYLALTLLCMGIMLCFFYVTTGNLYFGIGLHAGWVWAMRMGALMFARHEEVLPMVFGPSMTVAKSGAAFMFSLLFLLVAVGGWAYGVQKGGAGD
ncbi:MAG: CPBP family intramembrane metalloprotease, partial [Spartobacteria bacterium]|nr:CPBP family intramembrane metalloprotease [Spartobacteria bacterium]